MNRLAIPLLILLAVLLLGGFKSIRNSFAREATREVSRELFKHY